MISDSQLRVWAAEAKEARESALWEYCPKEFWLLLTEVAELKRSDVESQIRLEQGDRIRELKAEVAELKATLEEQATELARRKEEWL